MQIFVDKTRNMTVKKLMAYLGDIKHIEQRMIEIEKMDKKGLSLDEQEQLLIEYNELWDRASKLNNNY